MASTCFGKFLLFIGLVLFFGMFLVAGYALITDEMGRFWAILITMLVVGWVGRLATERRD